MNPRNRKQLTINGTIKLEGAHIADKNIFFSDNSILFCFTRDNGPLSGQGLKCGSAFLVFSDPVRFRVSSNLSGFERVWGCLTTRRAIRDESTPSHEQLDT